MLSSVANVIIWDKMLSSKANVIMVSSGASVIIWCYHVMLSSGMITPPFLFFLETSLTRLFLYFPLITSGVNFCIDKSGLSCYLYELRVVDAVVVVFLLRWHKICPILQPMGSKGRCLKKCPKPCWPIKARKSGLSTNIIKPTQTHINRKKYANVSIISEGHLKKLKTRRDAYSGLYLSICVIKSPKQLMRQSF